MARMRQESLTLIESGLNRGRDLLIGSIVA